MNVLTKKNLLHTDFETCILVRATDLHNHSVLRTIYMRNLLIVAKSVAATETFRLATQL